MVAESWRDEKDRSRDLTICIAATCENSRKIVAASDRMWTAGVLSLEFEHTRSKIVELSDSCVMMTAGPALRDVDLQKFVKKELAATAGVAIPVIVEKVKEGYQAARRKKIEELYLSPRGLTLAKFLEEGRALIHEVAMVIDEHLATYDYGLEVLVAGVDSDGAHIYKIDNPGTVECFDAMGYHTIGSGEPHAAFCLIDGRHSHERTLQETMWSVFEAKKIAERAPGVGQDADFAVIEAGRLAYFGADILATLEDLWEKAKEAKAKCLQELRPAIAELPSPFKKP